MQPFQPTRILGRLQVISTSPLHLTFYRSQGDQGYGVSQESLDFVLGSRDLHCNVRITNMASEASYSGESAPDELSGQTQERGGFDDSKSLLPSSPRGASEQQPQPQQSRDRDRGRRLKRVHSDLDNGISPADRHTRTVSKKQRYMSKTRLNTYRVFFNSVLQDAVNGSAFESAEDFEPGQLGLTCWSKEDKHKLLTKLNATGIHNLPAFTKAVANKTELEVRAYLLTLSHSAEDMRSAVRNGPNGKKGPLSYSQIPASAEISAECNALLDDKAEELRRSVEEYEAQRERDNFGAYWLLNHETAGKLEDRLNQSSSDPSAELMHAARGEKGFESVSPAAELLALPNWLELSTRFFMNRCSENRDENWMSISPGWSETPAIFATAFMDFHNLAVSFTRRVISAAIFEAASRIRARDVTEGKKPSRSMHRGDVLAALQVLGVASISDEYWVTLARRSNLRVEDAKQQSTEIQKSAKQPIDYDEVERRLRLRGKTAFKHRRHMESPLVRQSDEAIDRQVLDEHHRTRRSDTDSSFSSGSSDRSSDTTAEDKISVQHEKYADLVDHLASAREEQHLWKDVLGRSLTPEPPEAEFVKQDPRVPAPGTKLMGEQAMRWENLDFPQEWEQTGRTFLANEAGTTSWFGRPHMKLDNFHRSELTKGPGGKDTVLSSAQKGTAKRNSQGVDMDSLSSRSESDLEAEGDGDDVSSTNGESESDLDIASPLASDSEASIHACDAAPLATHESPGRSRIRRAAKPHPGCRSPTINESRRSSSTSSLSYFSPSLLARRLGSRQSPSSGDESLGTGIHAKSSIEKETREPSIMGRGRIEEQRAVEPRRSRRSSGQQNQSTHFRAPMRKDMWFSWTRAAKARADSTIGGC